MTLTRSSDIEYDDGYARWKGWADDDFGRIDENMRSYYRAEVSRTGLNPGPGLAVLEIGFGNGSFLAFATEQGWSVTGTEVNMSKIATARERGYSVIAAESIDSLADRSFDLIAIFDVLEHMPAGAGIDLLGKLRGKLAPGGSVIMRFPNGDSPLSLPSQNGDITHVHAIGSNKARQMLTAAGLDTVAILPEARPVSFARPAQGLYRLFSKLVVGALNVLFRYLFFSGSHLVPLSINLIVIGREVALTDDL